MPPPDVPPGESFSGLIVQLRGRIGLTQRELASLVGVSIHSIQVWEAGANSPGLASLKSLIAVGVRTGAFTAGNERAEAQALWAANLRDAPRFRAPFDEVWFAQLVAADRPPVQAPAEQPVTAAPSRAQTGARGVRRASWGEAPDAAGFVGRASESARLRAWLLDERTRLLAVLGLGGIGKTLLTARVTQEIAPSFERVFWRSLRDAPTPGEWLAEAIGFLAPNDPAPSQGEAAQFRRLLELLRDGRCLLVLDNFETVLQPGGRAGEYRPGYERYGALLRQLGEAPHRSCLVVTSREEPRELGPLRGDHGAVWALTLAGLGVEDGRALLDDKQLDGSEVEWQQLVGRYGGNGLALKVVGETTREVFGGSIADYLDYATTTSGVVVSGVRQLLGAQVQRLSDAEHELLRHLAVAREPVGLVTLATELGRRIGRADTLEAVEALRRRSLLERTEQGSQFSLHSVVLEYVTDQLVEDVAEEIAHGDLDLLLRQPLLRATGKEYMRRGQERLVALPIVQRLIEAHGSARSAEVRLMCVLDRQRGRPIADQGYGPGNLVNLLRLLRGNLKGVDLSGLAIRQAYLQEAEAQGASLAGAYLSETVLGEAFSHTPSLALSADGAYLVAGMASGAVCWWRVSDRTLLGSLEGHAGTVYRVALSRDARLIASGGMDRTVRLWDAENGRPRAVLRGHTGAVRGVALSGDGRRVASGSLDGTVRLWDGERGDLQAVLHERTGEVYSVALSVDGRRVASGSLDGTVRLWDAESGRLQATLDGHVGLVLSVALSDDGRLVASGGADGTVRLWDAERGQLLTTMLGHAGLVLSVALSGDGRLVASAGADGAVRLWEAAGGLLLTALQGHTGVIFGVSLDGAGRLVASGSIDGTVRLWEAETGQPLAALQGHSGAVMAVSLARDGRLAASGTVDGMVRLWDLDSGGLRVVLAGHTGAVRGVALNEDGRIVASGGVDGTVRLWAGESGRSLATLHGHTGVVRGVALSDDGRLVASGGVDGTVRLWTAASGRPLVTLDDRAVGVLNVALSGDGRLVASGGIDGVVRLWEVESGRQRASLQGPASGVWGVAFDGAGRLLASGGDDGVVRVWDAERGRLLAALQGHGDAVRNVALSADGRLVASCSFDGTVRVWDVGREQEMASLSGHIGGIWALALSADGEVAVSGGDDGTVRVWAPGTGAGLRTLRADRRYERVEITGLTGVTEAQRQVLFALGAFERRADATPSA